MAKPVWGSLRVLLVGVVVALVAGQTVAAGADRELQGRPAPAVLVGAGDIAGPWLEDEATAKLLDGIEGTVFTLGDNAYLQGSLPEYLAWYELTWGRHKARTRPAAGNHDFESGGGGDGSHYFAYFGPNAAGAPNGYYSYEAGLWHVIVLNGECSKIGGCGPGSPQEQWLRADLELHPNRCTLAMFHYPRFNSGEKGESQGTTRGQTLWNVLYEHGADVMLSADNHIYERFAPQTPTGVADPKYGIRQFTVGTGGALPGSIGTVKKNSEVRFAGVHGVLKLTLDARSYAWDFIPIEGQTASDSGSALCHGRPGEDDD